MKVKRAAIKNLLSAKQRQRLKEKKSSTSPLPNATKLKDQLKAIPQKDGETNKAYKLRALRELRAGKKTQKPSPKAKGKAKAAPKKPPYSVWPLKKGSDSWTSDSPSAGKSKGKGKGKGGGKSKGQSKGKSSKGQGKGKSSSKPSQPSWWTSDTYVKPWNARKVDSSWEKKDSWKKDTAATKDSWKKDSSAAGSKQWTKKWSKQNGQWKWEWQKNW